jgi:hypothetical protein
MNRLTVAIISLLILCSCATVKLETNLPSQQLNAPIPENKTRVVFFNESNKVLYADGSWRIGIKIDGEGVANLHFNQYVQIDLTPGKHSLELSHVDVFTFRDKYDFNVTDKTMYVKVYNGLVSTKFQILPSKPNNFEINFRPTF